MNDSAWPVIEMSNPDDFRHALYNFHETSARNLETFATFAIRRMAKRARARLNAALATTEYSLFPVRDTAHCLKNPLRWLDAA